MSAEILWRPFEPENIRNPYGMYETLRRQDPVHAAQTREIIITKYEDVKAILKDPRFETGNRLEWLKRGIAYLEQKGEDLQAIYEAINSFVLMLNPPQHTMIRNFVMKAWSNRDVDQLIEKNVALTLTQPADAFDAIADFAQPLSVYTICDILGIDGSQHRYLKDLGLAMSRAVDLYPSLRDLVEINQAAQAFIGFFRDHISVKLKSPDDALLSRLLEKNKNDGLGLTESQLISIAIFLFIAGQETSSALIGNVIYSLLQNRDAFVKLKKDHSLIDQTIEETLRYNSPVQLLGRMATENVILRGKTIEKGSAVTLVVGSANHDEEVFTSPQKFDISRKPNRHLSFGSGIHFCLGDWLGRRQAQLALKGFITRFTDAEILTRQVEWNKNLAIRSIQSLLLKVW